MIANAVAAAYEEYHVQVQAETLGDAFAYLEREKNKTEKELKKAEEELQAFREKAKGISMVISEEGRPAHERLQKLNEKLTGVQLEKTSLAAQIEVLKDIAKSLDASRTQGGEKLFAIPVIRVDSSLEDIRQQLVEADKQSEGMTATYGPEHPALVAIKAKIRLLRDQFRETLNQVITLNGNQVKMLEAEELELAATVRERKGGSARPRERGVYLHASEELPGSSSETLDALVQRMLEVDISSGYSKMIVQVVEKASPPTCRSTQGSSRNS